MIDDDKHMHRILQLYLRGKDVEVVGVSSGRMALHKLEQEPFDLILTDIQMPGMNGIDLFKEVIKIYPDAVVYVVTGHPTVFEQDGCLALGIKGYFAKPASLPKLYTAAEGAFAAGERK